MATTPRLAIPYPVGTDPDDVPTWMHNMATLLDGIIAPTSHGAVGSRPTSSLGTPGIADRAYWATDVDPKTIPDPAGVNGVMYRDTGNGWEAVGPYASKVAMGSFLSPAAIGNQDYTGLGFMPKLVEFKFIDTSIANPRLQFGDGGMTTAYQYAITLNGGLANMNYSITEAAAIRQETTGGVLNYRANYVAMLADGFRLNWVNTNGTTLKVVYKAWG